MDDEKKHIYLNIDNHLHDMQTNLSKINSKVDSTDFFEKMVELAKTHPEAYDLIQAMILLFSKMETSNKQFQETIYDTLTSNIKIKQKTLSILKEHSSEIEIIRKEIQAAAPKKNWTSKLLGTFFEWISNTKTFGLFLSFFITILLFFSIYLFEKFDKEHFHKSVNNTLKIIKGEPIKEGSKDDK